MPSCFLVHPHLFTLGLLTEELEIRLALDMKRFPWYGFYIYVWTTFVTVAVAGGGTLPDCVILGTLQYFSGPVIMCLVRLIYQDGLMQGTSSAREKWVLLLWLS